MRVQRVINNFCFKVIPHITDAVQDWVERVAKIPVDQLDDREPDICVIEVSEL